MKKHLHHLSALLIVLFFSIVNIEKSYAQLPPHYKTGAGTANTFPMGSTSSNKVQWVYYPSNFPTATTMGKISKIYFRTSSAATAPFVYTNLVVKMGYTTLTSFTTGPFITGLQTCLNAPSYTIQPTGAGNWVEITLTNPFIYDPSKNFLVEVSQTAYTAGFSVYQMADPGNRRLYGGVASSTGTAGAGGLADFGFNLDPLSTNDAGVVKIDSPTTFCSGVTKDIYATIKNMGMNQITSVNVNWSVDGVLKPVIPYTTLLDTINGLGSNTALINLGSVPFPTSAGKYIRVWTSLPNGVVDTLAKNDTSSRMVKPSISGTLTVGTAPGRDYPSLAAAANDISTFGICGPVVINVDTGTYIGKVGFTNVLGSSSVNTIKVNGHGAKIKHTSDANDGTGYVLQVRGVNYVTIDSLEIELLTGSTKGFVVSLGDANNCVIKNCKLIGDQVNTGSTYGGLIISGSNTSYSTATVATNNTFENNDISGGYLGISIYGATSAAANLRGNTIVNNTIHDYYVYGIYNAYGDSTTIVNNNIHRLNRTTISTGYGIYFSTGYGANQIIGNKIHDLAAQAKTGTNAIYGIYGSNDATINRPNIIANNSLYNLETNGAQYCLYNAGSDYTKYYYNTVAVINPTASAGLVYGLYYPTAAVGSEYFNNNIYINKGGSANKYGAYWSVTTNPVVSNYNNIYVENIGTGLVKTGRWGTTDYALMSDWKTANSNAFDQNSVSADPVFSLISSGSTKPNSPNLNDAGTSIVGITTDITGLTRSVTPDIGAYEFTPSNDDAGITNIISPVGICPGIGNVTVRVKNFGLSTLGLVNVNWSVNGVVQTPLAFSGAVVSGSDTALTAGTYNFLPNTSYNIKIWTSAPNNNPDANALNDTVKLNNLRTGLLGTVTVGGAGANFATLTALAAELNSNGVCGPVVVNVNQSAGPYLEQIVINSIKGVSSTNTLTINGNGSTIRFTAPSSAQRAGIRLNGASYVTIDSFIIESMGRGASAWGAGVEIGSGSNNNTIKNCKVFLDDSTSSTNHIGMMICGAPGSYSTGGNYRYNKIINNQINGGYFGITLYGISGTQTAAVGNEIVKNRISNFYIYGIYNVYPDSTQIIGNDISRPINKFASTFYGMYQSSVTRARIEGNKIHNAWGANPNTTNTAYCIYLTAASSAGNENVIVNNTIYDIRSSGSIYGIYGITSSNSRIYHNTLSFDHTAASAGALYGIYIGSAANVEVKNNAISITRGGAGLKYGLYYSFTLTGASVVSNYNNIYVNASGGNYGYANATAQATLANFSTATAYELNSISADLNLNGTRNMVPQTGSPLVSAGTPVALVTKDLLGNLRSTSTPYIGAYEVSGDYIGPKNVFVPVLNTISTSSMVLTNFATVTDISGVDTSLANRPRIYYKKTTDNNFYTGNTSADNGWKYTVATNNSSPFSFVIDYSKLVGGTVSVGDRIEYFVVSKDLLGNIGVANASLQDDPTSLLISNALFPASGTNSYRIAVGKSGTVFVGTNETYKTLTGNGGVFEDINNNLLSGNIDIVVKTNLAETGVHGLNAFAETGGTGFKISIRPNADTLRTISGAYVGGLIRINGADRVTIDGRYNGNGSYFKFENTTTTSGSATIQVISLGQNAGSENFTLRNSTIIGGTAGNAIPVHIGGSSIPYSSGSSNNKVSILNNTIYRGSVGIYSGSTELFSSDSLLIENNILGSDITAEQLRLYGMAIEVNQNAKINNNIIKNIINTAAQQAWGIAVYDGFKNGVITNNNITKVSSGSGAFGGRGLEIISNKLDENIYVANNFIGGITGTGAANLSSTSNVGITIRETGGVKLYFNSVSVSGNVSRQTSSPDISAALHIGSGTKALDIKNNSFSNTLINVQDTAYAYAFYTEVEDTAYTAMDYNNFNIGSSSQGILGRKTNADLISLAQIKLAMLGKNVNSIAVRPNYLSDLDLHAKGVNMYQKGTPIVGITTDIDGNTRSTTVPCIGADEFTPLTNDLLASKIIYPGVTGCGTNADSVSIVIDNVGLATQTGFPVTVNIAGAYTGSLNKTYTKNIPAGGRDTVNVGYYNSNVSGTINLTAFVNSTVEQDRESDTVRTNSYYSPTPVAPTVQGDTTCVGQSAVLTATSSAAAVQWFTSAFGGTSISTSNNFTTGPITKDSVFYVQASNLGASTSLVTTMAAGNGQSGAMFDLEAKTTPLQITGFSWNQTSAVSSTIEIWTYNGTYLGNDASSTGWTLVHSAPVVSVVGNNTINLPPSKYFVIQPGQLKGVYFTWTSGSIAYSNLPEPTVFQNSDLKIITGRGKSYPFASGSSFAGRAWNGTVHYNSPGCPSPRVPVYVKKAPKPAGSTVAQATPFQGVFNAGTSVQPDAACLGDTLSYNLTPPTGFSIGGLGTTWTVNNAIVKTVNGATPASSITMSGLNLVYIAAAGDVDSTLIFTAQVASLLPGGCDSTITRYLKIYPSPVVNIGANQTVCAGTPVTLDAGNIGSTYLWSTGATTQTITVSSAGSYSVKVTNPAGCDSRDTMSLLVTPVPVVTLGQDIVTCIGQHITLDAGNPGATYLWSTGSTSQTIVAPISGTYIVTVTSGSCSSKDTINVLYNALPTVELGTSQQICTSDTIILDAGNPGSTYLWSTGATTRTIGVSLAGNYKVTVTNANGCISRDSVIITNKVAPNANFTYQGTNTINVQFDATPQIGSTFSWNFGDPTSPANTSALVNPIHQFTQAGTYFVTLTVTNVASGCVSVNVDTVIVTFIGVNATARNTQNLKATPNPFVGKTAIEYTLAANANAVSIEVYDVVGRKVATLMNNVSQLAGKHSLEYINEDKLIGSGVYIVQLTVDGKTSIIRMVDIASR